MGATVVLVCRDRSKGESVVAEILERARDRSASLLIADLASQASIRGLVDQYLAEHEHLHVLVNNAGVYFTKRHVTVDGIEATLAVNYLAPFLLTNLLLDVLKRSAPARVINVIGSYHAKGSINFDDLQGKRGYNGARAIAQSKLAEVLFTYELARRLEGTGVTANCLDPGMVATNLIEKDADLPKSVRYGYRLVKPFLKSPARGAETAIYLASSPDVERATGKYFAKKKAVTSSPKSYDIATAGRLWETSAVLANLGAPR